MNATTSYDNANRAPQPDGIKVVVAAHKPYWMPSDPMYLPVQAGATGKASIEGFQRDDEGDNISAKNPYYCELTALYWAWKNADDDHIGLVHYRRHFKGAGERGTLTGEEAARLLVQAPVIVPKKRNYFIETVGSHYGHTFSPEHIEALRAAMAAQTPDHLETFDANMEKTTAHMFNMLVMRKDILDAYLTWLLPILQRTEEALDVANLTAFHARAIGRLSELMLDTWLDVTGVPYVEVPVQNMERTNWLKKGSSFLAAKFAGKKYEESF